MLSIVWIYLGLFAAGVAASFTPCTYPVLPITIGYIGNASNGKRGKAFFLSLILVLGMAFVYALLGVIFAAIGSQMGALWANGYVVYAIGIFFILMALFLVDVFQFPVPGFLNKIQAKAGQKHEGWTGAFVVGCVSGLVVGPCTGPIIGAVLVTVGTTLEEAHGINFVLQALGGGFKLFLFGLGQGTLILLCGIFAGLLTRLPKSGKWLIGLKKVFALIMIFGASLLLVYVGQATDFPDLTKFLATTKSSVKPENTEKQIPKEAGESNFGGDDFLE